MSVSHPSLCVLSGICYLGAHSTGFSSGFLARLRLPSCGGLHAEQSPTSGDSGEKTKRRCLLGHSVPGIRVTRYTDPFPLTLFPKLSSNLWTSLLLS